MCGIGGVLLQEIEKSRSFTSTENRGMLKQRNKTWQSPCSQILSFSLPRRVGGGGEGGWRIWMPRFTVDTDHKVSWLGCMALTKSKRLEEPTPRIQSFRVRLMRSPDHVLYTAGCNLISFKKYFSLFCFCLFVSFLVFVLFLRPVNQDDRGTSAGKSVVTADTLSRSLEVFLINRIARRTSRQTCSSVLSFWWWVGR